MLCWTECHRLGRFGTRRQDFFDRLYDRLSAFRAGRWSCLVKRAEYIRNIYETIRDFLLIILFGTIGGIAFGLLAAIGVIFLWHHPIWGVVVACIFGIFHIEDLRRFYVRGNWLALTLRPIAILLISAPVAGMVWLAIRTHSDSREYQLALVVVLIFAPASLFFVILSRYFPNSRLFKFFEHGIDGIRITGVF